MPETCWKIPSNLTTSKHYCAFVGINIVFFLINSWNMDHLKQEQRLNFVPAAAVIPWKRLNAFGIGSCIVITLN